MLEAGTSHRTRLWRIGDRARFLAGENLHDDPLALNLEEPTDLFLIFSSSVKTAVRHPTLASGGRQTNRMLKDAMRSLRRTPGFVLVVVLTLGLGIGTSVTTFTVMQGVLWKPLPYPGAERLVLLEQRNGTAPAPAA